MKDVEIRHLTKRYGDRLIFKDVNLTFPQKGFYAILGDSGCGKSTFLDMISGLDVDYSGEILTLGVLLKEQGEDACSNFRLREIGYVRQNCDLLGLESALDNVLLPLKALSRDSERIEKRKARDLLRSFGLEKKTTQRVNTLSGGEKQRVALARALITDPPLLLCDEPTGALDGENAEMIYSYLAELSKKRLVIVVSHDEILTKRYAEHILRLADGSFSIAENEKKSALPLPLLAASVSPLNIKAHMPFRCWLKHSYHVLKAKKGRSLMSSLVLSFSLLSFGLSLYVSRDLSKELKSAFSSLTGEGSVVMEKTEKSANPFNKIISSSENQTKAILATHPNLAKDYGVSYLAPFESYFPELNLVEAVSGSRKYALPEMSIRSVNDFLWLDEEEPASFYPECPPLLEEDQIVLGLPFRAMTGLCLFLQINRDYASLGRYLQQNRLEICFSMRNDAWGYFDSQSVRLLAVKEESVPTIYHYDHFWSTYLLQERMRFPSSDEPDSSLPWIMQKVFYLEPREGPEEFMKEVRGFDDLRPYVFERASYQVEQTHCFPKKATDLTRFYCYCADRNSLSYADISSIAEEDDFSSFEVTSLGSYVSYPEALASGFAKPFYLANSLEGIEALIDAASFVPKGAVDKEISLPEGTVVGSYLKPLANALSYSSDFSSLREGRLPKNEKEVCLSSALSKKLFSPAKVYVAGCVGEEEVADRLERDYRLGELTVVGIVEEENDVLFALPYWAIDYFRDELGMSAFYLEPDKVIFHLKSPGKSEQLAASLGKKHPNFRFIDPTSSVSSSIREVISYVNVVLRIASSTCLLISVFLLLTVALLSTLENRNEGRMLFVLGIRREEIAESYSSHLLLLSFSCFLSSVFTLVFGEYSIDQTIQANFSSSSFFVLDICPLLAMFSVMLSGFVFVSFVIKFWVDRHSFRSEGR